jgi:hypothetical protein
VYRPVLWQDVSNAPRRRFDPVAVCSHGELVGTYDLHHDTATADVVITCVGSSRQHEDIDAARCSQMAATPDPCPDELGRH